MLKRVGENRHPCRTPTVVLNQSLVLPFNRTALWALSYRLSMIRTLALMLYFLIVVPYLDLVKGLLEVYEDLVEILLISQTGWFTKHFNNESRKKHTNIYFVVKKT